MARIGLAGVGRRSASSVSSAARGRRRNTFAPSARFAPRPSPQARQIGASAVAYVPEIGERRFAIGRNEPTREIMERLEFFIGEYEPRQRHQLLAREIEDRREE